MPTLRSMTAFGRASHSFDKGTITVEMQSVNRRFLELNFHLPHGFFSFESLLRKQISSLLGRGGVNIFIKFVPNPLSQAKIMPNISLAKGLKEAWDKLATALEVEASFSLSYLLHEKELFTHVREEEESIYIEPLTTVCNTALIQLIKMKEDEGTVLAEDLLARLATIAKNNDMIEQYSQSTTEHYRKKLLEKMEALLAKPLETDERLLKEIALFAEKVDTTEEIVRLRSHIQKMNSLLTSSLKDGQETKGKTLDFLVQEMMREINTIGAKALDQKVIHLVIESKAELEKIKEQSQNIE